MRILTFLILLTGSMIAAAQVAVHPAPEEGYDSRIRAYIDNLWIVDTHEHLTNPSGIKNSNKADFMILLHQYADDDIKSAGMSKPAFELLLKDSLSAQEKWTLLSPWWEKSSNTAYNRAVMVTMEHLFGVRELNGETVALLSEKIRNAYQTDWYDHILREKCRIRYVINDNPDRSFGNPSMFRYTQRFEYFRLDSREKVEQVSKRTGFSISTPDDLVNALNAEFEKALKSDFVTIKTTAAYQRTLFFEDVSRERAEESLRIILAATVEPVSAEQAKPLADFMMHRMLDLALKHDKPVQIHTGLQAGDGNYIENANPTHLANLFLKYRDVRFVLLHGGYPFGSELASLAKNFRNVYIDLAWLYIISPSFSERYLHEWLETIPASKIMGFGGDYDNVENVYAHQLFARQVIGNVLVQKVKDRYLSEKEALQIASMLLYENAVDFYRLDPGVPEQQR
jgi:uncharacterized protein